MLIATVSTILIKNYISKVSESKNPVIYKNHRVFKLFRLKSNPENKL